MARGLCQSRHALEQDMPVAEESDEKGVDEMFLSHDDAVHSHGEVGNERALLFDPHVEFTDIN